jgi:hypothetical protein
VERGHQAKGILADLVDKVIRLVLAPTGKVVVVAVVVAQLPAPMEQQEILTAQGQQLPHYFLVGEATVEWVAQDPCGHLQAVITLGVEVALEGGFED